MKKIVLLISILIVSFSIIKGQTPINRVCVTPVLNDEYELWLQKTLIKQSQFSNRSTNTVYTIPVIFHIIHNGEAIGTGRNISQALINEQIEILNNDFRKSNTDFSMWVTQSAFSSVAADCEINFCAATLDTLGVLLPESGIDRINRNVKGWNGPSYIGFNEPDGYIDATIKAQSYWNPNKYFNIWILEMSDGVLGYAQYPDVPNGTNPITDLVGEGGSSITDGVVLDFRTIASNGSSYVAQGFGSYNKGRTATHEVGHWLGLRHINGDLFCGNDYVNDTPTQNVLSTTCPATPGAIVSANCSASANPPGKMYQNYMDYSDDKCLVMFTEGQKARMQACMANCNYRMSLATSTVCAIAQSLNDDKIKMFDTELYPNPTNGVVQLNTKSIHLNNSLITILDVLGNEILELKLDDNVNMVSLDLSDQAKGIYFVILKSNHTVINKRLIIN